MPITPPPPAPNRSQPASFSSRMDAFLGWLVGFVPQLNGALSVIGANGYATTGGSANAISLTAGYPELVTGMRVRFKANSQNTGPATINLDGFGARQCRTMRGTALPAGYIRSDVETQATFDGTYWVLDRQAERGSNANGSWVRLADGSQTCTLTVSNSDGLTVAVPQVAGLYRSEAYNWTFPVPFSANPRGLVEVVQVVRWGTLAGSITSTQMNYAEYGYSSLATPGIFVLGADGFWY